MKVRVTKSFRDKLNEQINFIAQDKPAAARKFKSEVLDRIRELSHMPYKNRKSIYFDKDEI
ncbi:MAG: type II toxin-antitoxin system RelE/ParE family toxin [Bacteroidota bacterium]